LGISVKATLWSKINCIRYHTQQTKINVLFLYTQIEIKNNKINFTNKQKQLTTTTEAGISATTNAGIDLAQSNSFVN